MININVADLDGAALDWAVATCEFVGTPPVRVVSGRLYTEEGEPWSPSTDWSLGGPIIERALSDLVIQQNIHGDGKVHAYINSDTANEICCWGSTILLASMRCYVTSVSGPTLSIPAELAGPAAKPMQRTKP